MTSAIFMPNMIKTHQLEYVFFLISWGSSVTDSKSVARCVAIINIFIINNGTTFRFFGGAYVHEPPSISVADISLVLYKSSHFLFRIPSKYKPKRFNCSMFSKMSPEA